MVPLARDLAAPQRRLRFRGRGRRQDRRARPAQRHPPAALPAPAPPGHPRHRLGQPADTGRTGGTFKEVWALQWHPAYSRWRWSKASAAGTTIERRPPPPSPTPAAAAVGSGRRRRPGRGGAPGRTARRPRRRHRHAGRAGGAAARHRPAHGRGGAAGPHPPLRQRPPGRHRGRRPRPGRSPHPDGGGPARGGGGRRRRRRRRRPGARRLGRPGRRPPRSGIPASPSCRASFAGRGRPPCGPWPTSAESTASSPGGRCGSCSTAASSTPADAGAPTVPGPVPGRRRPPRRRLDRGLPGRRRQPPAPRPDAAARRRRLGVRGAGRGLRRTPAGAAPDLRHLRRSRPPGARAPTCASLRAQGPARPPPTRPSTRNAPTGSSPPPRAAGRMPADRARPVARNAERERERRMQRAAAALAAGARRRRGRRHRRRASTGDDAGRDSVLDALYGDGGEAAAGPGPRQRARAAPSPRVARWLGDIRSYFPASVVSVLQRDAMERLGLAQLLLEPELLGAVQPDVHLVGTLLALRRAIPEHSRETARVVVRSVTDQLEARLAAPTRQAVTGALHRAARTRPPQAGRHRLGPHRRRQPAPLPAGARHGHPRTARRLRPALAAGRAGRSSSASTRAGRWPPRSSTPRCSAPCWPRCGSLSTRLVAFDTAVVDLTDELDDPVDVLFGVQLGGGTDIAGALDVLRRRGHPAPRHRPRPRRPTSSKAATPTRCCGWPAPWSPRA